VFFAEYVPLILIIILIAFAFRERGHVAPVALLTALSARYIVKSLIVLAYSSSRPYVGLEGITLLIPPILSEEYQSFPSGHALFFFAMATVLYAHNKKLGIFFYTSALLMGIARVVVGAHYPSDIAGGALIGILIGLLFSKLISSYGSRSGSRRDPR
jgi:undecaprenyl-diphosphatase